MSSINKILQFLVPKDRKFFPMIHQFAEILVEMASTLHEAVNVKVNKRDEFFTKLEKLDDKSEALARKINLELSKSFRSEERRVGKEWRRRVPMIQDR